MAWRYFSFAMIVEEIFFTIASCEICDLVQNPGQDRTETACLSHFCPSGTASERYAASAAGLRRLTHFESVIWSKISPIKMQLVDKI